MKKYIEILKKCRLFDGISDEELSSVLSCLGAKVVSFDKKYTILAEGSPATYFGIMLSGTAQIVKVDFNGNRSVIDTLGAGELFGEAFACAEITELPVSVIAEESCEVMLISCRHLLHTCSNACSFHQQLIFNLMKDLATKTLVFHKKIEITSKRSTREKLLTYLSITAKERARRDFDIPFDRQGLADYLEVERSGLSAEISKLRQEGVIDCRKNHFTLL